jgi:hypothetical protein
MQGMNKPEAKVQSMNITSDLLHYFEGYEPDLEDRLQRKVFFYPLIVFTLATS